MNKIKKPSKYKKKLLLIDLLIFILFTVVDQGLKYYVTIVLSPGESYVLQDEFLEICYTRNYGAAFGMLEGQQVFLSLITIIFFGVLCYILLKMPEKKKYNLLHISLAFLSAGALSNMIDRLYYGYVIDCFRIIKFQFPMFNLADIYISGATILLVLLFLFVYRDKDFSFLNFKQQKYRILK